MRPAESIQVEGLSKTFAPSDLHRRTLKERLTRSEPQAAGTTVEALEGITFTVNAGECFGVVGHNGSGKSTLLQLLAGIYPADSGHIDVRGTLAPIIDLGVGFNKDLPAVDNLVANGVLTGLNPAVARARAFRIITLAGLDDFLRLKVKNYSSGMRARLAFATMVHTDADILLLDEVLAVGDAAFRKLCALVIRELLAGGRTAVLVTHQMSALTELCERAMLLHRGEVVALGSSQMIAERYQQLVGEQAKPAKGGSIESGDGRVAGGSAAQPASVGAE
jgi:ABC-type polysaccharide/polyol phosphate transport system ATPase subunit